MKLFPNKSELAVYKKAYSLGIRKNKEIEFINRSNARKRENSSNWKGGIKKTAKGYRQLLMPEHRRADVSGYVMEHIVIYENETGIEIPPNCCIHHLNGIKDDNRIENLRWANSTIQAQNRDNSYVAEIGKKTIYKAIKKRKKDAVYIL